MNKYMVLRRLLTGNQLGLISQISTASTSRAVANAKKDSFSEETASNETTPTAAADEQLTSIVPDVEDSALREQQWREEIERKRDVSRFSKPQAEWKHRNMVPDLSRLKRGDDLTKSDRHFRRLYARLGRESGVEPGVSWPNLNRLNEIRADEKEYDLTLQQKIAILIERKNKEIGDYEKLVKDTTTQLMKMPKMVDGFFDRVTKKRKQAELKESRKQEMKDKAREIFGYEIDPRDPRFLEIVAEEKSKKKKSEKKEKKAAAAAAAAARTKTDKPATTTEKE